MSTCVVCGDSPIAAFRADWPMTVVATDLPTRYDVHLGCRHELESAVELLTKLARPADGAQRTVLRWASNDRTPLPDLLALWLRLDVISQRQHDATRRAHEAETAGFLAAYAERRRESGYSAEELAEMRAAFGPGEVVVDVITGERIEL